MIAKKKQIASAGAIIVMVLLLGFAILEFVSVSERDLLPTASPSGEYQVRATVDNGLVTIRLLDRQGHQVDQSNSRASTYQKWALGWMEGEDTVVLYSADTGSKAWAIVNGKLVPIDVTHKMYLRTEDLYKDRYK